MTFSQTIRLTILEILFGIPDYRYKFWGVRLLMIYVAIFFMRRTFWNILLNPYEIPRNMLPVIWESVLIKSRFFLFTGSLVWMMVGLLNLQKREKFV